MRVSSRRTPFTHTPAVCRFRPQTNPGAKNAGPILLQNVLLTVRTLSSSLFIRTLWALPGLQILRRMNKSLSFVSR